MATGPSLARTVSASDEHTHRVLVASSAYMPSGETRPFEPAAMNGAAVGLSAVPCRFRPTPCCRCRSFPPVDSDAFGEESRRDHVDDPRGRPGTGAACARAGGASPPPAPPGPPMPAGRPCRRPPARRAAVPALRLRPRRRRAGAAAPAPARRRYPRRHRFRHPLRCRCPTGAGRPACYRRRRSPLFHQRRPRRRRRRRRSPSRLARWSAAAAGPRRSTSAGRSIVAGAAAGPTAPFRRPYPRRYPPLRAGPAPAQPSVPAAPSTRCPGGPGAASARRDRRFPAAGPAAIAAATRRNGGRRQHNTQHQPS